MIEPLCYNQDCLIVGSAPSVLIPDGDFGCILGANGGAAIAQNRGLDVDCLVTTSYLFRGKGLSESEKYTINILDLLFVQHIWVDIKSGPMHLVEDVLEDMDVSWQEMYEVDPADRNIVVSEAVGRDLWVSSGVWAACLAVASGASSITLVGISLNNGHYGIDDTDTRDHITQDRLCLDLLKGKVDLSW